MKTHLLLGAALLAAGFLWATFIFSKERLPQGLRSLFLTGWEALLIGFAIGPGGFGLISRGELDLLDPLIAMGLGWAGMIFGVQLRLSDLKLVEPAMRIMILGQAAAAGAAVFVIYILFFALFREGSWAVALAAAIISAAACSVSSPTAISLVAASASGILGPAARPLMMIATLDLLPALIVTGVVFCIYEGEEFMWGLGLAAFFYCLVLALLLAGMFLLIDRKRLSAESNLTALMGFIIFMSGAAFYLGYSPLFTGMATGAILANILAPGDQAHAALRYVEKPFYVILLLLAGMWWTASEPLAWLAGLAVVAARIWLKTASVRAMARSMPDGPGLGPRAGLALCSPGALALCIGLNFLLQFPGEEAVFAFGVIAVSTMFSEAMAPALIRMALAMEPADERA